MNIENLRDENFPVFLFSPRALTMSLSVIITGAQKGAPVLRSIVIEIQYKYYFAPLIIPIDYGCYYNKRSPY